MISFRYFLTRLQRLYFFLGVFCFGSLQVQWEIDRNELEWESSTKLGAGAFGEVMKAKWRGTPVAVKKGR